MGSSLLWLYENISCRGIVDVMISKKINYSSIFWTGIALSAGPAILIDSYSFAKNLSMDYLLFYILQLIAVCLAGVAMTYFAYRSLYNRFETSVVLIVFVQLFATVGVGALLLKLFIAYQISYGYYLLPIAIDLAGALILLGLVEISSSRRGTFNR